MILGPRARPLKRLSPSARLGTKPILPASWLTNGEVGRLTRRRRLTFLPRQLCPNELSMHGPFFDGLRRFSLFAAVAELFVTQALALCASHCMCGERRHGLVNGRG